MTVNLLIYFTIFSESPPETSDSSHHKTTSTMSQPIDVVIIIYLFHNKKIFTLYIIIHKVHFRNSPPFFYLFVTSSDVFARKSSLNYCVIFSIIRLVLYHLNLEPFHKNRRITLVIYKNLLFICIYSLRYAIRKGWRKFTPLCK